MKLSELSAELGLECLTPELAPTDDELVSAYASDLLSDVLAHGPEGGVLITVQVHLNVVAVAMHAEMAAVIFALNRRPDETVRTKAVEEGLMLYVSRESAFDIAGRLYTKGVRGPRV